MPSGISPLWCRHEWTNFRHPRHSASGGTRGKADLIARDTAGVLYFYKGTGSAAGPFATRVQIGSGWSVYDSMTGVGDWSGDGKPDLVTRDTNGQLYLYQGTGSAPGVWAPKAQVGTGWNRYDLLF
ncbi:FG-GAP-like repeat-containing protein [Streptomyces sp. NPDC008139]|uniref:FG-GAP repeat domain-containing protein n=1 Tax=Streptomyces sp. NPDC008139 TaxID=3364814 RepID=UPI0036ECB009